MTAAVMATKLYAPRLRPGSVARPRLHELLRRAADSRLTLVSAPAGFGKTTLLAEWLHETTAPAIAETDEAETDEAETDEAENAGRRRRAAWLSLDAADRDPRSFWTCVVAALQTAVPGLGAAALQLIGVVSAVPVVVRPADRAGGHHPGERARRSAGRALAGARRLPPGRRSRGRRRHDLPARPPAPQVHVVLGTRADPDLPLSRWRVRGELTEVRAADLRFTDDEVAAYLDAGAGLSLPRSRSRPWRPAPRAGSPRCSSPPCRCMAARTSPVSSPRSPATTATSSTTWSTRCCATRTRPGPRVPAHDSGSRPAHRPAVRRGHRSDDADGARRHARERSSAPTCSSSRSTTGGSGTATTTCSPTCCGPGCSPSARPGARCCTGAPASGSSSTTCSTRRSPTPWPGETSTAPSA